jgi:hypothetical protein
VYWVLLIASGLIATLLFFVNKETNPEIILGKKVIKARKELDREDLISWYERDRPRRTKTQILMNGFLRPLKVCGVKL